MSDEHVTRQEIWDLMDEDTRNFIRALTAPFETTKRVSQKVEGTPYSETVEVTVEERVTLKAIKLETKGKVWIKGHPSCQKKPENN